MRRSPIGPAALLLALGACSGGDESKPPVPLPRESTGAVQTRQPLPETPPALSPAEQDPGKPVDLGEGLLLQVDKAGSGTPAHLGSLVRLQFTGKVKDAENVFASTEGWDAPLAVKLGGNGDPRLLPAFERALIGLRAGCSASLEVPPALGYGKNGPPGTEDKTLVFQIELVGVDG